jgi:hypothetical protein
MVNEDAPDPGPGPDQGEPGSTDDPTSTLGSSDSADVPSGEDGIPLGPLSAMRTRLHSNRRLAPGEEDRIRDTLGSDDDTVYVIDDGADHCMIAHRVGQAPDGCLYCLVARIALEEYADAVAGELEPTELFSDARDISLCGVVEEDGDVTNVFLVQHYRRARDVPPDYLPGSPFLEFTDEVDEEA